MEDYGRRDTWFQIVTAYDGSYLIRVFNLMIIKQPGARFYFLRRHK